MHALIEWALLVSIILLVMRPQGTIPSPRLFHASGSSAAFLFCEPGARLFTSAPWIAGASAAIQRKRSGAEARRE